MADNTTLNSGTGGDTVRNIDRSGVKTQVVQLDGGATGSEALINSLSAGTGMNGLMVAIGATNYVISTANATTTQLAGGAIWTGTIESGNSEPSVSVIMNSDQPGLLTINQYITSSSTTLISSQQFYTQARLNGNCFARSFTLNGNYVNVSWQNQGPIATTTLNIDTAYGTIPATTNLLNGPVALNEVGGTAFAIGQQKKAASLSVAVASDQNVPSIEVSPQMLEVLRAILIEQRIHNSLLMQGLLPGKFGENLDNLRADEDFQLNLNG